MFPNLDKEFEKTEISHSQKDKIVHDLTGTWNLK